MRYDALRYFVEIAEQGSINKASDSLYISQPNLSKAIRNLEEDFKLKLLERSNKGITLTEQGREVYFFAKRIFTELDLLEQYAQRQSFEIPTSFSLAVHGVFLCGDVFNRYFTDNMADQMQFQVEEATVERVLQSVAGMDADLGVAAISDTQLAGFKRVAEIKNLSFEELGESDALVLAGPHSPLYGRAEATVEELVDQPLIRLPDDYFSQKSYKEVLGGYSLSDCKKRIVMNHFHSIIHLIKNSEAVFLSNRWGASDLGRADICAVRLRDSAVRLHLMALRRKNELLSTAAESFYAIVKSHYQAV